MAELEFDPCIQHLEKPRQLVIKHCGDVCVKVGPLPEVVADLTAMRQIVGDIIGNAVKYLDPDRPGEIEITAGGGPTTRRATGSGSSDSEITSRVRDNGRGLDEKDMDKVFAPFRRVGKQDVPGEGMGLPDVQALVRRHGGRTWVESEGFGRGSTFCFTLPEREAGDGATPHHI